jgi:membrane protein implicated in regulation of membrane protease activity
MITLYLVTAAIGLLLAGLSLLGIAKDADAGVEFDGDVSFDADSDVHIDHEIHHGPDLGWIPFLSVRFWTYFCAAFGSTGLLLTWLTGTPDPLILTLALAAGLICGTAIAVVVRVLRKSEADSNVSLFEMLGQEAIVTIPIRPGLTGKVRAEYKGEILDLSAVAEEGVTIEYGDRTVIVAVEGHHARVVPLTQLYDEQGVLRA